ncbi:MAG: TetR/AcrR family transcriptional regulator [Bacteroidia bacterium]
MGIPERKERDKQEIYERILEGALRMFGEHGYEKTTIRKIASEIEYSAATIYLYFPGGKDELMYALHEEMFQQLHRHMQAAFAVGHPVERLRKLGRIYIQFALEHPCYYDLMFVERPPMKSPIAHKKWDTALKTLDALYQVVKTCIDTGYIGSHHDIRVLCHTIWSFVHGIVTLHNRDRMRIYGEDSDWQQLIQASLDAFVDMLLADKRHA